VAPEAVEFSWNNRIVVGNLNLVLGEEKAGKRLLLVALTKMITTGDLTGTPEIVVYCSTEERRAAVIRPRMEAAGVDLGRLRFRTGLIYLTVSRR